MKKFKRIFLHCSDSEFGHALMIREWHVARGFKTVGYGLVIQNGYPTADWYNNRIIIPHLEGSVEVGRPIDSDQWFEPFEKGAGVYGWNEGSFHICMIGKYDFSNIVLQKALEVVDYWRLRLDIPIDEVWGHYEKDPAKSCPNIGMAEFRAKLRTGSGYKKAVKSIDNVKDEAPISIFQLLLKLFTKRKNHG